jgi:cell division septum initiation protein DivIVA
MSEISVVFKNKLNGYDKRQVNEYIKSLEGKLQEKSASLANLQQQVAEMEARLSKLTGDDASIEEKVELYDKLMKKMDGDYTNLLTPAIAKAKAIEAKAEKEYEIRIDQARYAAEGIYTETADRIAGVVDQNMDRIYNLLDEFLYSKTAAGRFDAFVKGCKNVTMKVAAALEMASKAPAKAYKSVKTNVSAKYAAAKERVQRSVEAYKEAFAAAKKD